VPVTLESRLGIASVTKMITAVVALTLIEGGLLSFDQPLIEVMPRWGAFEAEARVGAEFGRQATRDVYSENRECIGCEGGSNPGT